MENCKRTKYVVFLLNFGYSLVISYLCVHSIFLCLSRIPSSPRFYPPIFYPSISFLFHSHRVKKQMTKTCESFGISRSIAYPSQIRCRPLSSPVIDSSTKIRMSNISRCLSSSRSSIYSLFRYLNSKIITKVDHLNHHFLPLKIHPIIHFHPHHILYYHILPKLQIYSH